MGDLRWRPPQPVEPWEGVRDAAEFGFSCVYVPYPPDSLWSGPEWEDPAEQNEDCLHLNVWTQAETSEERRSVMVWIHGGGLEAESGVDHGAQGLGVGRSLLRHVLSLALEQRDSLGCVGVVTDAKPEAVAFYARYGFEPLDGVREGMLHGGATLLFLSLGAVAEALGG